MGLNYNRADRERPFMKGGKRLVERVPQSGHTGDYTDRRKAPGVRYVTMVRHDGNTISFVLTCGASHMDANSDYGKLMQAKARFLGWYGPEQCPVAMYVAGQLDENHFADASLLKATPCNRSKGEKGPCEHSIAEKAARMAVHNESQKQIEIDNKDKATTLQEKAIAAQREQTEAMVQSNRELAAAIGAGLATASKGKKSE